MSNHLLQIDISKSECEIEENLIKIKFKNEKYLQNQNFIISWINWRTCFLFSDHFQRIELPNDSKLQVID